MDDPSQDRNHPALAVEPSEDLPQPAAEEDDVGSRRIPLWEPGPPLLRPGWRLIAAGIVTLLLASGLVYRYVSPIRTAQLFVESLLGGGSIPDIVSYQCGEAGSNAVFDPSPELSRIFNEVH